MHVPTPEEILNTRKEMAAPQPRTLANLDTQVKVLFEIVAAMAAKLQIKGESA
jgi:hypothetical protein